MKWKKTTKEEKEINLNLDYFSKEIIIYTNIKSVYLKISKIDKPDILHEDPNHEVTGVTWYIPFKYREKIKKIFKITNYIPLSLSKK